MKKPFIVIVSGIIIIATILAIKSCTNSGAIQVTTEKVKRRTIIETVSANGKIEPEVQLKISSDVSGEIVDLLAKEGDHVKKGDLLVKIKPDIYQSSVDQANAAVSSARSHIETSKAQLAQMKAQFANAEATFQRTKKLFDQGAVSKSDYDNANASYESLKAQVASAEASVQASKFNVESAEASMKEAKENLNKTSIYAAVSGTVSKLDKEKGERVVGTNMMEGTEIMTLANLNEMEVNVDVNENDIVRVHLNDTADIQVDAYMDRKFKGIVTEIANSANTSGVMADQVTNFSVKIRILQESYKDLMDAKNPNISPFRPGMSATVDIHTKTAKNILSLPIQAVTTRSDSSGIADKKEKEEDKDDYGAKVVNEKQQKMERNSTSKEIKPYECVFIYSDGKVKLQKVKTGIQDNEVIEITDGLKEGTEVVSGPYIAVSKLLKDGMEVNKSDKEAIVSKWKKK